jgi:hypothetical protein
MEAGGHSDTMAECEVRLGASRIDALKAGTRSTKRRNGRVSPAQLGPTQRGGKAVHVSSDYVAI